MSEDAPGPDEDRLDADPPDGTAASSSVDDFLQEIVAHVRNGGTASLEALVADSEAVSSVEELLAHVRDRESLDEMIQTALVNAAYGEQVEDVRAALAGTEVEPGDTDPVPDADYAVLETLPDGSNVLVLAGVNTDIDDGICRSLIARPSDDPNVLIVTMTDDPDARLGLLSHDHYGGDVAIVSTGEGARSVTTMPGAEGTERTGSTTIETIPDPSDLPKLGITVSRLLDGKREDGRETVVCFHSLTALLQYAGRQRVFRFIQVLQDRLGSTVDSAHYHMDPAAHDRRTVATLRPLFDAVVEVTPGGEVRVTA